MHQKQVLSRTFADESARIERNAFDVPVGNGFHLDELRVHVVRPSFRHRGQSVGSEPSPRRNANVHTLTIAAKILSPRIVTNVDLDWAVQRVYARVAISAKPHRADVARPSAVVGNG